jgi:REP element-mobilizing transposase RayT
MVRGIEGCPIFRDDQDRQGFISRLSELVEMTGTRVLAWTLMENHIHLLIFSGPQGISKLMRRGQSVRSTLFTGAIHKKVGGAFHNVGEGDIL